MAKTKAAPGWTAVGVMLPQGIVDIIKAAGGDDLSGERGMPYAMASIIGALPWIAVVLYEQLPPNVYAAFRRMFIANMQAAVDVVGAKDPKAAFNKLYDKAKRSVQ